MSLEAANDQDGGHSSTMDDHGVSNPPSMQVSDNGDGSNFVTRDELRAQFKNFESMLAQFSRQFSGILVSSFDSSWSTGF